MIKKLSFFLLISLSAVSLVHANNSALKPLMKENHKAIIELQRYLYSPQSFSSRNNSKKISTYLGKLEAISEHLPQSLGLSQKEGLKAISEIFRDYFHNIKNDYQSGQTEYVRHKVRTGINFCFTCHSAMSSKNSFKDFSQNVENLPLSDLEKADFYVISRQFDKAIPIYEKELKETDFKKKNSFAWFKDLKKILSLSVRVKDDPVLTKKFLQIISQNQGLPKYLKDLVDQWKKDTDLWMKEKWNASSKTKFQLIKKAKSLIDSSQSIETSHRDHLADIRYLRAINYLNLALENFLTKTEKAEVFKYLGLASSHLEDSLLWDLDEFYYISCIESYPHSDIARTCYQNLANEIYFDYSGSSGLSIPKEETALLERLEKLAE